ncbi:hypothetical protein [Actinomadura sp. NPDC048394]|uniref:hypothetical protein n=1 Tax=Actinomadura sp. NPDC048394 TaxID=3158223 RepID=UPI0033CCDF73
MNEQVTGSGPPDVPRAYRSAVARWGMPRPADRAKAEFGDLVATAQGGQVILVHRGDQEWAALIPVPPAAVADLAHLTAQDQTSVHITGFPSSIVAVWQQWEMAAARAHLTQLIRLVHRYRCACVLRSGNRPVAILAPIEAAALIEQ